MPVFSLDKKQLRKAGIKPSKGTLYFLSMPFIPNAGFEPFIYSNDTINKAVKVVKEITMTEAFAL
jgi:hypothetical protein